MKHVAFITILIFAMSCKEEPNKNLSAQEIVDKSIAVSGGVEAYEHSTISFTFRDRTYRSEMDGHSKTLQRLLKNDTVTLLDVLTHNSFQRFENDSLLSIHDSLATKYGNALNSVHYFSKLPYGLNDAAVNKALLGETIIKDKAYYKVKVTFDQEGGGDDFDDTYVYFFNKKTFKPDYLAYDFHVDGGGMRFREAYNERYIEGIRFVDYNNMKPIDKNVSVLAVDSLYNANGLELLSKIELEDVQVSLGNYN